MAAKLPPLNALRLFEAAGRHGSFKRAAEELHVTPSAVSHGIQTLEDWLGTPLFIRTTRGLRLSAEGAAYHAAVRQALDLLVAATLRVPGRRPTGSLSLSVPPTFGNRWLMPRLHRFVRRAPGVTVKIDTSHRQRDLAQEGIDLAIRMGSRARADAVWIHLLRESFVPVCSPRLCRQVGSDDIARLVREAPLLHLTTVAEDWGAWLKAANLEAPARDAGLRFDTLQMALEAAIEGLGVAIGRKPLVDEDVAEGRLVEVGGAALAGATSYWLVGSPLVFDRPEAQAFRDWLLEELDAAPLLPTTRPLAGNESARRSSATK